MKYENWMVIGLDGKPDWAAMVKRYVGTVPEVVANRYAGLRFYDVGADATGFFVAERPDACGSLATGHATYHNWSTRPFPVTTPIPGGPDGYTFTVKP